MPPRRLKHIYLLNNMNSSDLDFVKKNILEYPWLDMYLVGFDEVGLTLVGTMDSTYGYQMEFKFKNVAYIDMPTSWHAKIDAGFIRKTKSSDMSAIEIVRYFDDAPGDLYSFSAETTSGEAIYHIAAMSFSFSSCGKDKYLSWKN